MEFCFSRSPGNANEDPGNLHSEDADSLDESVSAEAAAVDTNRKPGLCQDEAIHIQPDASYMHQLESKGECSNVTTNAVFVVVLHLFRAKVASHSF